MRCPGARRDLAGSTLLAAVYACQVQTGDPSGRSADPEHGYVSGGCDGGESEVLRADEDGLVYLPDPQGNILPDFSHAGYLGGGRALPYVLARVHVQPQPGDDGAAIQAAIDALAEMPVGRDGFRGAVLLAPGLYEVAGTIKIRHGGIVLRGAGGRSGETTIIATGAEKRPLIWVDGEGVRREVPGSRSEIIDDFVPFGSRQLHVERPGRFLAGDSIAIVRPGSEAWIHAIGMDQIPQRADGGAVVQWSPADYTLVYERTVTGVAGSLVTFDAPIVNAIEREFAAGYIYRYTFDGRISHVGIEHLALVSDYAGPQDEDHALQGVLLARVENAWVRDVHAAHFVQGAVEVSAGAKYVTIEDSSMVDAVSPIAGGRRYSFLVNGSFTLVQRAYARNGRHDFATGARVAGPNVFLDCWAENARADTGPHQRWATGTLYDNVRADELRVEDRGNLGTGQGWAGAQQVFWNCEGALMACQRPPTAQNFSIGFVGRRDRGRHDREACHWENEQVHIEPRSLYLRQLQERLGTNAVRAIASPEQLR
jgi:hypothetical protein